MTNTLALTVDSTRPFVDYTREFEAPVADLFRAHTDPLLYGQWIGPEDLSTDVEQMEARDGGAVRFVQWGSDGVKYAFRGVFHTVRENDFILQTFEYEGFPDIVTLEYATFTELPGGRSRLTGHSVFPSLEARERFISSGMEEGMASGYDELDNILQR